MNLYQKSREQKNAGQKKSERKCRELKNAKPEFPSEYRLYHRLLGWLKPYAPLYVICSLVNGLALFLIFSSTGVLLREILAVTAGTSETGTGELFKAALYLAIVLGFALVSGVSLAGFTFIEQRIQIGLREGMTEAYLHAKECAAADYPPSEILNRMNKDVPESARLVGYYMNGWIFAPILSGMFSILLLLWVDWSVALLCVLCALLNSLVIRFGSKQQRTLKRRIAENKSELLRFVLECMEGASEVRSFRLAGRFQNRQQKILTEIAADTKKSEKYRALRGAMTVFVADGVTIVSLLVLGAVLAGMGQISFADIMLALPLSDQIGQMLAAFGNFTTLIRMGAPGMERVYEIMDLPAEEDVSGTDRCENREENAWKDGIAAEDFRKLNSKKTGTANEAAKALCFREVSFSYNNISVLEQVSFTVSPGERIAFVGESGSGKSTILKLLLGLYAPTGGCISVGGKRQEDWPLADWREQFAYLSQENLVFHTSVEKNIALSNAPDREMVCSAARLACAEEFIRQRPGGYETMLGERHDGFSGGELQRIGLARCLYRQAPFILLDEPTSALDEQSSRGIKEAIARIPEDRAVIAVTHRMELVTEFDRVYRVAQGNILEGRPCAFLRGC